VALLNAVYGVLVLPETLATDGRRAFALRRANPVGGIAHMRRYPIVIGLMIVLVFHQIAHDTNPAVWSFYTMLKFGWSEFDVGLSISAVGLSVALVQGGLIRPVMRRLGEERTVYVGLGCGAIGAAAFALAPAGWMVYPVMVPWALVGLAMPAMRAIMSRAVPADAQGALQGAIAGMMSLTAIVTPLVMTQLFTYFTSGDAPFRFPGASFMLAGLLMLAGLVRFAWTVRTAPETAQAQAASR